MVGLGLMAAAAGMAVSAGVELADGGPAVAALVASAVVTGVMGVVPWRLTSVGRHVRRSSTFAAAAWTWIAVSLAGALPFLLSGTLTSVNHAVFESVSGFTATGSTVLAPIEGTSDGVLFWRSLTQWYGGMGMIVLAVAILPFLGVGGLELLQAEGPGPTSEGLAHRVSGTARRLWLIYVALTAACTMGLLLAGTGLYDAVTHSFTAVATGGFSRYDASVAQFDSLVVEGVLVVAMLAGATSFTLHWWAVVHGRWAAYLRRSELRFWFLLMGAAATVLALVGPVGATGAGRAVRQAVFTAVSVSTTTGFGVVDQAMVRPAGQLMLLVLMVVGAMAGSTSGALKAFRAQVMFRLVRSAVMRARHRTAAVVVRADGRAVPGDVVDRIASFCLLYALVLVLGVVALASTGLDVVSAVGGAATTMGGVGPGLGSTSIDFTAVDGAGLVISDVLMLAGRLEIVPLLLMGVAAGDAVQRRRQRGLGARARRGARLPLSRREEARSS